MKRAVAVALSLALLTFALYAPVRGFDFVAFDDPDYVTQNLVVLGGISLPGVWWSFTTVGAAGNWHPLTWISHMIDVTLFGVNPGAHHLVSALLHAAATAVLSLALYAGTGALWPCILAAALFAVHPLHVESVAWVAERKDVLAALFGFAAIGAWVRYARRPTLAAYLAALGVMTLPLLAKPTFVTLPLMLLILDWWPLGRWGCGSPGGAARPSHARCRHLVLLEKIPPLLLAAGVGALTWAAQQGAGALNLMDSGHASLRIANALLTYVRYLAKMFWPAELAVSYTYPRTVPPAWHLAGALLLLVGLTLAAVLVRRRFPWVLAGWAWYLATLLPMVGFVKTGAQAYADRYTYIPLVGIFVVFAWSLRSWSRRPAGPASRLLPVIAGVLPLLALLPVTASQLSTWRSSETLFAQLAAISPGSFWVRAEHEYRRGLALARAGRYQEAETSLAAALRIRPAMAEALNTLGAVLLLEGRDTEGEARLRAGLFINPNDPLLHGNLAMALRRQGRSAEADSHEREAKRLGLASTPVP